MALATTLRSSAQACRRVAPAACGNRRSIVRALNVRAFQEQNNEQQQPEQALQRQEQARVPVPYTAAPRLPSLFREMEKEMEALSRGFFGGDLMMRSPWDMLGALRDMPALMPELEAEMPAMRLATDIKETDTAYELKADIPGLSKEDVKIRLTPDRVLQISGERQGEKVEEVRGTKRVERTFGRFSRTFVLPQNVDESAIKADARDGVLTVVIPKAPAPEEPQAKEIPVA